MNFGIRIVKRNALLREELCGGGFTHPKRTCQTENKHWLAIDEFVLSEESQQWQKRKAEDREIIPLDPLEQVYADAFELIASDACHRSVSSQIEIFIEKTIGKIAHDKLSGIKARKNRLSPRTSASAE